MLLSGALLFVAGLAFVPLLAVPPGLKTVLAITWAVLCGYEWLAFRRGYAASRALRIAAGGHVERQCRDGSWQSVRLCAGSVVLSRFAWLRVAPPGAGAYSEALSAARHESEDWRRLQVIWRHIGAA